MQKYLFMRPVAGAEYFIVKASSRDEALAILENAENPYLYHDETITDLVIDDPQAPAFEFCNSW